MNKARVFLYSFIGCELLLISFLFGYLFSQPRERVELLVLNERLPVWNAIQRNAVQTYDREKHNCVDFSLDLMSELKKIGVASELVLGTTNGSRENGEGHAWVGLWIEPTSGKLVSVRDGYERNYRIDVPAFIEHREQNRNEIKNDNNKEN